MTPRRRSPWFACLALGLAPSLGGGPLTTPVPGANQRVSLADVRQGPRHWLGASLRCQVQLRAVEESTRAYPGRFVGSDWVRFSAWPDELLLWDREAFEDHAPMLFVRKDSELEATLREAGTYARFELRGVVREAFAGEPWIEVTGLSALRRQVVDGTLLHVERAIKFMRQGRWKSAIDQLERARVSPLPAHVSDELARMLALTRATAEEYRTRSERPKR